MRSRLSQYQCEYVVVTSSKEVTCTVGNILVVSGDIKIRKKFISRYELILSLHERTAKPIVRDTFTTPNGMLSVNNEIYDLTDCRIKSMRDEVILLIVYISQCVGGRQGDIIL